MSEYINRDELLKIRPFTVCGGWICRDYDEGFLDCADEAREAIKNLPAADVAEVKHGKWIGTLYDGYADGSPVYEEFECSLCGCEHNADGEPTWSYCPDCGAKMDLKG